MCAEKRWKSVQPSAYYRYESFFREVCYNKLAERMVEAGYKLDPSRPIGFTIQGFPDECRKIFSNGDRKLNDWPTCSRPAIKIRCRPSPPKPGLPSVMSRVKSSKLFGGKNAGSICPEMRQVIRTADRVKRVLLEGFGQHCPERGSGALL